MIVKSRSWQANAVTRWIPQGAGHKRRERRLEDQRFREVPEEDAWIALIAVRVTSGVKLA